MSALVRLGIEVFLIGALIYVGWDKPYQDWAEQVTGRSFRNAPAQRVVTRPAEPAPPSGAWMHDPNHHSVLDRSQPQSAIAHSVPQPSNSRQGSWLLDPNHRSTLDPPHKGSTPH